MAVRPRAPCGLRWTGNEYEIDLSPEHSVALRTALEQYVAAARKSAGSQRPVRRARRAASSGLNSTEVREWAKSQGIDVKELGRIPAELVVKFQAAAGG